MPPPRDYGSRPALPCRAMAEIRGERGPEGGGDTPGGRGTVPVAGHPGRWGHGRVAPAAMGRGAAPPAAWRPPI